MLRNLFHISVIAQVLFLLIMAQVPANGEVAMAILDADGQRVPLTFRMEDSGLAYVTSQRLSSRFGFREDTINVEEDIFDVVTSKLTHTLGRISHRDENNNMFWTLHQVVTEPMASLNLRWLLLLRSSLLALPLPAPFNLLCHVM
jgi:hypothetical protein